VQDSFKPCFIESKRIRHHVYLTRESSSDKPVLLLLHGNASDGTMWFPLAEILKKHFRLIIPDLRGYGFTERTSVDAENGVKVWVDDIMDIIDKCDCKDVFVAGHSLGGMVAMGLLALNPNRVRKVILLAPGSPFGFGGTKDETGNPTNSDFSGSGAGLINPQFLKRIKDKDRSEDNPATAPASVIKRLYFGSVFNPDSKLINVLLDGMFRMATGAGFYPGDVQKSDYWPYFAPSKSGPANAVSSAYNRWIVPLILQIEPAHRPQLLWVHGTDDKLVSDQSMSDAGTHGKLGLLPDWPGMSLFPPQPMYSQIQRFVDLYDSDQKITQTVLLDEVGHCPHIECVEKTATLICDFLR